MFRGCGTAIIAKETVYFGVNWVSLFHVANLNLGIIGLANNSDYIIDLSFDILSLEALFLLPR